jgi:glutathione S-transferase
MKLYYSPGACSLAPHIVGREAGLEVGLEKVDIRGKKTDAGADYLQINPKGAVPALELDGGEVLTENAVVLQYLAEQGSNPDLLPRGGLERWRVLELLNYIATELHKGFGPLWNPGSPPELREATVKLLGGKFDFLARQLGERPYLTGDRFTIADAYFYAVFNWTRFHKIDTAAWPTLQAYQRRVSERPAVAAALKAEGLG